MLLVLFRFDMTGVPGPDVSDVSEKSSITDKNRIMTKQLRNNMVVFVIKYYVGKDYLSLQLMHVPYFL